MAKPLFGLTDAIPDDAAASFGARAILKGAHPSVPPDRFSWSDDSNDLRTAMAERKVMSTAFKQVEALVKTGRMAAHEGAQHVLYEDADLVVVGDTRGSYGYLYLAAWLKPGEK
jgi:hypothetical protein